MSTHGTLIESEQSVIGSLIKDNNVFDLITDLKPESFIREDHRVIYKTIISFLENGRPVDIILLAEELERQGQLEHVGGLNYIGVITQNTNTSKNIKIHANSIKSAGVNRKVRAFLVEMTEALEQKQPVENIIEKAESGLFNLLESEENNVSHIG